MVVGRWEATQRRRTKRAKKKPLAIERASTAEGWRTSARAGQRLAFQTVGLEVDARGTETAPGRTGPEQRSKERAAAQQRRGQNRTAGRASAGALSLIAVALAAVSERLISPLIGLFEIADPAAAGVDLHVAVRVAADRLDHADVAGGRRLRREAFNQASAL